MRVLLDLQGCQTASRLRGIGRYTLALAKAIARSAGEHEVWLLMSDLFPDTVLPLREEFRGLVPAERIVVFSAPAPVAEMNPANSPRARIAELVREHAIAQLSPDVVHVGSLFEGFVDDAVTSIGTLTPGLPTAVTLYDLIPLLNADSYLRDAAYREYYLRKIESLKKADLLLAISASAGGEAVSALGVPAERVINISSAIDERFRPANLTPDDARALLQRFGLSRPFVFHIGVAEPRKNFEGLIRAFAILPRHVRARHQLLLVAQGDEVLRHELRRLANAKGIMGDEIVLVDRVSDEDLVALYSLCRLFVFPSLHEGFGLPPLEAMACGAAVIGSNASSIPEVIGRADALFDPAAPASIAEVMGRALADEGFHGSLRKHALQQAAKFSWDATAKRAIAEFESLHAVRHRPVSWVERSTACERRLLRLAGALGAVADTDLRLVAACVAHNALAAPERQLMVDVSELSQRDAGTGVQRVVRSYLREWLLSPPAGFRVEPIYATVDGGYRYARRFVQRFLGQSAETTVDDTPVQWQRGDIFFCLDMQHHVQIAQAPFYVRLQLDGVVVKFLVHDLLPILYPQYFEDSALKSNHERWLGMVAVSDGAVCVSKATADALTAWLSETATPTSPRFTIRWVHNGADLGVSGGDALIDSRVSAALPVLRTRPTFLCVGTIEPRKAQQQVLAAVELLWQRGYDVNLAFVGRPGWHTQAFVQRLRGHSEADRRLHWFDRIDDASLEQVYGASTCLVAASIDEGFGLPVVEAARRGVPVVARDVAVFREVAGDHAFYFEGHGAEDLARALAAWLSLHAQGGHPRPEGLQWSTWRDSADRLGSLLTQDDYARRQLLVDVSEIARHDARTGIQRVVRNVLDEWLRSPPAGWRVEPVYAEPDSGYRYARRFTHRFLAQPGPPPDDDLIEYAPGDVFFALDLQPQVQIGHRDTFRALRQHGVTVKFLVYDLLPVRLPHRFPPGNREGFERWLRIVAEADGAVCISRSVADELREWLRVHAPARILDFSIGWFHLGADLHRAAVAGARSTAAVPDELERLRGPTTFLMVGTLEPRKGHVVVLDAFDILWQEALDVNLVIVGKQGWMVDALVERLRSHPQRGDRLLWLHGIDDDQLETIYAHSQCLIAASEGEGFGLPLVEAAARALPIMARDIPVFREVAGAYAYYFSGTEPEELARAVKKWMGLMADGKAPPSAGIRSVKWNESATELWQAVTGIPKMTNT